MLEIVWQRNRSMYGVYTIKGIQEHLFQKYDKFFKPCTIR